MSRSRVLSPPRLACFPRVSGDEPLSIILTLFNFKFSPRERG